MCIATLHHLHYSGQESKNSLHFMILTHTVSCESTKKEEEQTLHVRSYPYTIMPSFIHRIEDIAIIISLHFLPPLK